jgi:alpha-glucosidase
MLDFGLSGWMADFGEYLPTDFASTTAAIPCCSSSAGRSCGAAVNAAERDPRPRQHGVAVFFLSAGFSGVQRSPCPLLWAATIARLRPSRTASARSSPPPLSAPASSATPSATATSADFSPALMAMSHAELILRWSELAPSTPVI